MKSLLNDEYKEHILKEIKDGNEFIGDWKMIRELFIAWNIDISKVPILNNRLITIFIENDEVKIKENYI